MLGDRIKELRKEFDYNQEDFAFQFRLSKSHISKIEANKSKPSALVIAAIADFFDVNEEWLLTGEGEKLKKVIPHKYAPKAETPQKTTACYAYKYWRIACLLEKTCNLDVEWDGLEVDEYSQIVINFILHKLIELKNGSIKSKYEFSRLLFEGFDDFDHYLAAWSKPTPLERKNKLDLQGSSLFVSDLNRYSLCLVDEGLEEKVFSSEEKSSYESDLLEHRYFSFEDAYKETESKG